MRDYAKVEPKAWHGGTFKALRKGGTEALLVGLYLMTSPSSNMIGLFNQPLLYMAHETGLGIEGARKGLQACIEAGFCSYDEETEIVWVHEMAKFQISEVLKPNDLRCKGVQKDYDSLPDNPFLGPFFDRYAAAFHMTNRRDPFEGACEDPSKPRTGTGARTGARTGTGAQAPLRFASPGVAGAPTSAPRPTPAPQPGRKPAKEPPPTSTAWAAYADAFRERYGAEPVRNAKVNGQLAQLLQRLGAEEAPHVARFYVGHPGQLYVRSMHSVDLLLRDAEALRTQWATRRTVTATQAQQVDRTATNAGAFGALLEEAMAREAAGGQG